MNHNLALIIVAIITIFLGVTNIMQGVHIDRLEARIEALE